MRRIKKTLSLDKDFCEWLDEWQKKTGAPPSRIIEIATISKFKKQYDEFLKNKKDREKEQK